MLLIIFGMVVIYFCVHQVFDNIYYGFSILDVLWILGVLFGIFLIVTGSGALPQLLSELSSFKLSDLFIIHQQ